MVNPIEPGGIPPRAGREGRMAAPSSPQAPEVPGDVKVPVFGDDFAGVPAGIPQDFGTVSKAPLAPFYERVEDHAPIDRPEPREMVAAVREEYELRDAAKANAERLGAGEEFERLRSSLGDDSLAQRALQKVVMNDALSPKERRWTLQALDGLRLKELTPEIDRARLVKELVEELADPLRIQQLDRGTCAPTTVQMLLAREQPSLYVDVISGLAAVDATARVRLPTGATLERPAGVFLDAADRRTQSSRLFQSAATDLANGTKVYMPSVDENFDRATGTWTNAGLNWKDHAQLMNDVLGNRYVGVAGFQACSDDDWSRKVDKKISDDEFAQIGRDRLIALVRKQLEAGRPVPIGMDWEAGSHKVIVERVTDDYAEVSNPHGTKDRIPLHELRKRIANASLLREYAPKTD